MKVFKVLVSFVEPTGSVTSCDAIDYKGGVWLVPYWTTNPVTGLSRPVRIVRVDQFGLLQGFGENRHVVQAMKVSKAVLEGAAPRSEDRVEESPKIDIRFSGPGSPH